MPCVFFRLIPFCWVLRRCWQIWWKIGYVAHFGANISRTMFDDIFCDCLTLLVCSLAGVLTNTEADTQTHTEGNWASGSLVHRDEDCVTDTQIYRSLNIHTETYIYLYTFDAHIKSLTHRHTEKASDLRLYTRMGSVCNYIETQYTDIETQTHTNTQRQKHIRRASKLRLYWEWLCVT